MKMDNNLQSFYRSNISSKLNKKTKSLQFLPEVLKPISQLKTINFNNKKIKVPYLIDIIHNLMLKYYFKKENSFTINATVLKQKYGHEYKAYVDYLVENRIISMKCNYKAGVTSRIYQLNPNIFKSKKKKWI